MSERKKHACSKCGSEEHNAQRCFAVRAYSPPPIIGRACGKCGVHGHDTRRCFAIAPPEGPRTPRNQCTYCLGFGHGSHRCPNKRVRKCETCGTELGSGARKQCMPCYRKTNQRPMRVCVGCGKDFHPTRSDSQVCTGSVECLRLVRAKNQAGRFQSLVGMTFGMWTVLVHETASECVARCACGRSETRSPSHLKDGRTTSCLPCSRARRLALVTQEEREARAEASARASRQRHYEKNKDAIRKKQRARRPANKESAKRWRIARETSLRFAINEIKKAPCMDCGNTFHPICMDFDHRPGETKKSGISDMVKRCRSIDALEAELAKCDLVCANCHRLRTWNRTLGSAPGSYAKSSDYDDIGPSPGQNPTTF